MDSEWCSSARKNEDEAKGKLGDKTPTTYYGGGEWCA